MNLVDVLLLAGVVLLLGGVAAWFAQRRVRGRTEPHAESRTRQMTELIEHANCVLWEAEVRVESGDWEWRMRLHPSEFCRQLFRGRIPPPGEDLWADFQLDRREEMERRARAAVIGGKAGYDQEFRATRGTQTYWLHEDVSITRLGPDRYWLVGLVTDMTAQREAEAARRQSEQTVERILAQAQCMIWRATVLEEGGVLNWPHFDMPRSHLSERLFGSGPRVFSPRAGSGRIWSSRSRPR